MTKLQYLRKLLDTPVVFHMGFGWRETVRPSSFGPFMAYLGRKPKPVKRFTPPLPAEYWRAKKRGQRDSALTSGTYHRSHVERFAHA